MRHQSVTSDAVFAGIGAWAPIYETYAGEPFETRMLLRPMALMVHRWDGMIGFPGGKVDHGEDNLSALLRELREEIAYDLPGLPAETHTHEHVTASGAVMRLHFMIAEPAVLSRDDMRRVIVNAAGAEHAFAEGSAIWVHLAEYRDGEGLSRLLGSGALAPRVLDELALLCERMNRTRPPQSVSIDWARARANGIAATQTFCR